MSKKVVLFVVAGVLVFSSSLFGLTLKQSVVDTLKSNPIVKERLEITVLQEKI